MNSCNESPPSTTETQARGGFTREVMASSMGQELNLLIEPAADLDGKFFAFDLDALERVSVNGWHGVFETSDSNGNRLRSCTRSRRLRRLGDRSLLDHSFGTTAFHAGTVVEGVEGDHFVFSDFESWRSTTLRATDATRRTSK